MPFITLLDTNTDQVHILNTLQDQIYSTCDSTQLRPQRWIIDWLTGIYLLDCSSQSINTLPATTLECADANASAVLTLSFSL